MIVPVDTARYTAYQSARGGLALTGTKLLAPIADANNNPYALHYGLAELNPIYDAGRLAFVLNMGLLNQPLTRAEYQAGLSAPSNLFSHSDQTTQAQTGTCTPNGSGWGGRLLDRFGITDTLAAVSVSSPALFLQGFDVRGNVVPPGANLSLYGMSFWPPAASATRRAAVDAILLQDGGNAIRQAANQSFADGLQLADTLQSFESQPPLATVFPTTSIGNQLKEVARLIRIRSQMGPGRQVFFCSMDGYDTHSSQDWTHWNLLSQLVAGARRLRRRDARGRRVESGHRLHAVGVQSHDADQRQRQRSRVGQPSARAGRRGGRRHLRRDADLHARRTE